MILDEHVSPELALVDPELAARLRAAHVPPRSQERQRSVAPVPAPTPAVTRRGWRPRPFEAVTALAFTGLLGAAFLPPRSPPTFAAPTSSGQVALAWPERRRSDSYLLEIKDGTRVVYQRRLERPYLDERFALVNGLPYRWRVFLLPRSHSASEPIARGTFVLGE